VVEERARLVVGADGHRSTIARLVDARPYETRPARTVASYTYWDGLTADGGEMYSGTGWAAAAWPTNDGLTLTYAARPIAEWDEVRRNPERALLGVLARAGDLGARARTATRIGPVRTTNDTGAAFHTASGSGWLLVGDAGLVLDPITGLGMTHALEDAASAAAAVQRALDGSDVRALKGFGRQRYRRRKAIYELTADLAQLRGTTPAEEPLFAALAAEPAAATAFYAAISGAGPVRRFFSPPNLIRILGPRGFLALARGRAAADRSSGTAKAVAVGSD
jgi:2-polyprenyl-6-methoxyphenol hydroxylase-like FAD-dependent oxidoreductase